MMATATLKPDVVAEEAVSWTATEDERLLVETIRGVFRVTVPKGAKVTFGPLFPAGGNRYPGDNLTSNGLYLRIYKTQNQQLAVLDGVYRFTAESLHLEKAEGEGQWRPYTEGDALANIINPALEGKAMRQLNQQPTPVPGVRVLPTYTWEESTNTTTNTTTNYEALVRTYNTIAERVAEEQRPSKNLFRYQGK